MRSFSNIAELYAYIGQQIDQETDFTFHYLSEIPLPLPFRSRDFRANIFSIVLIGSGNGSYRIDNQHYRIKDRSVFLTNPGHVKGFEFIEINDGVSLTFSERFLQSCCITGAYSEFPFLLTEIVPTSSLSEENYCDIASYARLIGKEISSTSIPDLSIVRPLLVALLLKIKTYCWHNYDTIHEDEYNSDIVKRFKLSLDRYFATLDEKRRATPLQAQELAEDLHLNPSYLGSVIKQKTGKTISQWIVDRTLIEAEAQLSGGNQSVQAIAYNLGFSEPTHFSKFFKKHIGLTPTQFRKRRN